MPFLASPILRYRSRAPQHDKTGTPGHPHPKPSVWLGARAPIPKDCADCGLEDGGLAAASSRRRTPSSPAF
eukprot:5047470-Alexandrium_andersonii.AAC.1